MPEDYARFALSLYGDLAEIAVPIAFVFGMCNMIVNTFFSVAFGGRLKIGGNQ